MEENKVEKKRGRPPGTRTKPKSRQERWSDAVDNAKAVLEEMMTHMGDFENAMAELRGVQEEYEEWKDNLPENLASSTLGEKLEEVCSLDLESAHDTLQGALDEVMEQVEQGEGIDLPLGFGRD
jgi:exonuclease VII small subunit